MPDTVFTVTTQQIGALDAKRAVELIADLLRAELRRLGVPITHANISMRINVPDGGVDASVDTDPIDDDAWDESFIPDERTAIQVKTGDTFKPWQERDVRGELFGKKEPSKDALGSSVRDCLDAHGTYVLVCTGTDPNEQERIQAENHFDKYFEQCGYAGASFEIWGQTTIVGLLERFPSLALKTNGNSTTRFQTHGTWSRQDEMRRQLQVGDKQKSFIETVQKELRRDDQPVHVRIRGEAGIGKTRLVLEATAADDLKPLVLYFDGPEQLLNSELMTELLREDSQLAAILVVDECDLDSRARIWNYLKNQSPRVKFISIYNDPDETTGTTVVIDAPVLETAQVLAIIAGYGVPEQDASRWAELCDGSPRVAHVVGDSLQAHPDNFRLRQPDTAIVWDRFVAGNDDQNSDNVRQRRVVLQHIALFRRVGFAGRVSTEAAAIAKLVEQANPQITAYRFREIVQLLRDRKVLQGESTLYITPRLLHIKLWADWWDTHGDGLDLKEFLKTLPQQLVDWFYEMFEYARESPAALKIAEGLLQQIGNLEQEGFFADGRTARLFRALTNAAPQAALETLQRTIGQMNVDQLLAFRDRPRRQVIWALEAIAIWREHFQDAARLLLRLAEAENENFSNNATGVFAELFSLGRGRVAPTEAPPAERFPVLKEALESKSIKQRAVGFAAIAKALKTGSFSRTVGSEYQGLRKPPRLWVPETWGELFDAYRRVWHFLVEILPTYEVDERVKVISVMASAARGLWFLENLFDLVTTTLSEISARFPEGREEIVEAVETTIHYEGKAFKPEQLSRLEDLRDRLVETDFHSRMKRHVGMNLWLDRIDASGNYVDASSQEIQELAEQVIRTPDLLAPELSWLVRDDVKNGYQFGFELAIRDTNFRLLPVLIQAQREAGDSGNAFFLSGYFAVLFQRDSERWERVLDEFATDDQMRQHVPQLTWRSGMTERAALRILALAKAGQIPLASFRMFAYGGAVRKIPEHVFARWIEMLVENGTEIAVATAIDLYHFFYIMGEGDQTLPRELTLRVLTASPRSGESQSRVLEQQDYDWARIAEVFLKQYPEDGIIIGRSLLSSFGEDGTITGGYRNKAEEILHMIAERFPDEIWKEVAPLLGPPIDSRAFNIRQWLRDGGLTHLPPDALWQWTDAAVDERAWYAATFVPPVLTRSETEVCWARELLIRYGARKDVRSNLHANFGTEVWTGPESLHYEQKKQMFEEFKKDESDPTVRLWLDEAIESLNHMIADARVREERGF